MALSTYDPGQVDVILAGIPIDGFADGTFISAEQDEDSFSLTIGSSGEGARAKSRNESATITFTLLQTSSSNDALSALHNTDILSPNGDGIGPLLIKDNSGRTLISAQTAWIQKPPVAEYAREISNREWTIRTDKLLQFHGGN